MDKQFYSEIESKHFWHITNKRLFVWFRVVLATPLSCRGRDLEPEGATSCLQRQNTLELLKTKNYFFFSPNVWILCIKIHSRFHHLWRRVWRERVIRSPCCEFLCCRSRGRLLTFCIFILMWRKTLRETSFILVKNSCFIHSLFVVASLYKAGGCLLQTQIEIFRVRKYF